MPKIGVVLALDGERAFTQAMSNATKQANLLKAELSRTKQEFSENANSMEALRAKQEILTKQQQAYTDKLEKAQAGKKNAVRVMNEQMDAVENLTQKLKEAESALAQMEEAGERDTKAYENQKKAVQEYSEQLEKQKLNLGKAENRVLSWGKKIENSKEEIIKCNKAIDQNAQYLEEAKKASDNCATSIDKYGKTVKTTTKFVSSSEEKLAGALITKSVDIAGNAIGFLADKAKEAAQYVVEVGEDFQTAMSKVEALSGATGSELEELSVKAQELGASTKFSATDVVDAFSYMSLAGWETQSMLEGIDGVLDLAAASDMELAAASDMVTDYLSAFGMEASESAKMADELAYAQANSNTTAEQLGEAYGNCAANLNTAGQDIETVTALLEAMANQGTKGSEAGTALSAIMSQITQKMQDGAIAIGNTSVSVQDSQGNFRDLTAILADVEGATEGMGTAERSAALAATFNRTALSGLNQVFTEGIDKVAGYEEELRNADGTASSMANTMSDNLEGKLSDLESATEGLGIAVFDYVSGPLTSAVEGATDLISGITDAITPQKTVLDEFIEDIAAANDEIASTVSTANETMSTAASDTAQLELYKDTLLDAVSAEEQNEYQKFQVKKIVEELSGDIPELAAAYDEETGAINLTSQEITELLNNREKLLSQTAAMEAQEDAYTAMFEAQVNAAKADSAVEEAEKALEEATENRTETTVSEYNKLRKSLSAAQDAQEDAAKTEEEATKAYNDTSAAVEEVGSAMESYSDGTADAAEATEDATEQISEAYTAMNSAIEEAVEDVGNVFDEYTQEDLDPEQILKNLEDQAEAFTEWKENLAELAGKAGDEMSEELYEKLADMGPEGASYVEAFTEMSDDELKKASEAFAERTSAMAEVTEDNMSDAADSMDEAVTDMEESAEKTGDCYDILLDAFSEAADAAKSGGEEIASSTEKAFSKAVSNAKKVGAEIPAGLAEAISSGSVSAGQAVEQINQVFADKGATLLVTAEKIGVNVPEGIRSGISAGGDQAVAAIASLNDLIKGQLDDTVKQSGTGGEESSESFGSGVSKGGSAATSAVQSMSQSVLTKLNGFKTAWNLAGQNLGKNLASGYAQGIKSGTNAAVNAAAQMAAKAQSATKKADDSRSPSRVYKQLGSYVGAGYAQGIADSAKEAAEASKGMAADTIKAAQDTLDINSPSKKFRKQVGQNVGKGFAFGIKDSASLAGDEADKMSTQVYNKATAWLKKYKKTHETSLSDEKYYWKQIAAHAKTGTDAYNKAIAKMLKASVSTTETSGSGKSKKTVKKDAEEYYSEILSAAETYATNQQILNDWSLERQLSYWKSVRSQLKKGTQAWYDATKEIKEIKAEIQEAAEEAAEAEQKAKEEAEEAAKEKLETQLNVQKDILSKYQVYNKMSAKAEMEYWDVARQQFAEGTDERIEADQAYLDAHEDYLEQLEELDEDYADNLEDINEELEDSINELQETYDDAVSDRKKEILSSMDLFESWDAGGYTKDTLMDNLETQVEGLKFWEEQLEALKSKNLSQGLLDELEEMGPDAAASLWSLNQMTEEELEAYDKLWQEKNNLAQKQAVEENEDLLKETTDAITKARQQAAEEIAKLKEDYQSAVAELNTGLSEGLRTLVSSAAQIGEDVVSTLISKINSSSTAAQVQAAISSATSTSSSSAASSTSSTSSSSAASSTSSTSSSSKSSEYKNVHAAIKKGTKHSKSITSAEKKAHSALWEYITKKYGYAPNNAAIKALGKVFGIDVGDSISASEKTKILKKLKAAGYRTGKKRFDEDGSYWLHEGELLVRKSDNALLKTMSAGEGVIPADLTENLMQWGDLTPEEYLTEAEMALQRQRALDTSGVGKLNRLLLTAPGTSEAYVTQSVSSDAIGQVLAGMQDIITAFSGMQMVTDTGALVGELQPALSRENAAVTIRKNRGRLQ